MVLILILALTIILVVLIINNRSSSNNSNHLIVLISLITYNLINVMVLITLAPGLFFVCGCSVPLP